MSASRRVAPVVLLVDLDDETAHAVRAFVEDALSGRGIAVRTIETAALLGHPSSMEARDVAALVAEALADHVRGVDAQSDAPCPAFCALSSLDRRPDRIGPSARRRPAR